MGLGKTFQTIASLYCLLTKGVNGQPTCRKPLILCPTSLVQVCRKGFVAFAVHTTCVRSKQSSSSMEMHKTLRAGIYDTICSAQM
jgi:hypothetical protein